MYRLGRDGTELRPFSMLAEVKCRGYSEPLQRVLVAFGAEESFGRAVESVREHYGIEVPESALRTQTESHGAALAAGAEPLGASRYDGSEFSQREGHVVDGM